MSKKLIRLSKSCLSEFEKESVMNVLDDEFLGMGEKVKIFEDKLSSFFMRKVVCVSSGTAALHLALQAADIGIGDEVLVQSLTYVSSFQAISAAGATPIACEVDKDNLCIDLNEAEKRLTPRTKAIMPVHYAGGVGPLNEVYAFAKKNNLRVIEDAAHAFGTQFNKNRVGAFGDITCFSFDGIKNITSGEGGCVVTNDENIIKKVSDSRLLGVENDSQKRFSRDRSWDFDVKNQGWRYHMSDIMAAIGIEQLNRFPILSNKRKEIAKIYDALLMKNKHISPLAHNYDEVVPHIYVVRIAGLVKRDKFRDYLLKEGIQIGYHYHPNHWLSMYKDSSTLLPVTDSIYPELITLPLHPDISIDNAKYVVSKLNSVLKSWTT